MLSYRGAFLKSVQKSRSLWSRYVLAVNVQYSSSQDTAKCVENHAEIIAKAHSKCRYKRLIKAAVRENGPFPEYNPRLSELIEESKKHDLSEESIDFSIKITLDPKAVVGLHEVTCPRKSFIAFQYEIVDKSYIEHRITHVCEPYDSSLLLSESWRLKYFDQKGVVVVSHKTNGDILTSADQEAMLVASGAESVHEEVDMNGKLLLLLYCNTSSMHRLKRNVQDKGYVVEEAYVGLVPKFIPELSSEAAENIANLMLTMSEIPEVDRLFANVS